MSLTLTLRSSFHGANALGQEYYRVISPRVIFYFFNTYTFVLQPRRLGDTNQHNLEPFFLS